VWQSNKNSQYRKSDERNTAIASADENLIC